MQLILDQICKSFGTKEVLKNASYQVRPAE